MYVYVQHMHSRFVVELDELSSARHQPPCHLSALTHLSTQPNSASQPPQLLRATRALRGRWCYASNICLGEAL